LLTYYIQPRADLLVLMSLSGMTFKEKKLFNSWAEDFFRKEATNKFKQVLDEVADQFHTNRRAVDYLSEI